MMLPSCPELLALELWEKLSPWSLPVEMSGKVMPLQGEESECPCAMADIPKAQALLP